jgi:hypothetical protein
MHPNAEFHELETPSLARQAKGTADEGQVHEFETKLATSECRIQELETQLSEALFLCDRYLAKASAIEIRLQAVLNSASWRVTAPMRRIMEPFPRLRFMIRAALAPVWRVVRASARSV